jgi:hypothetical protein
MKELKVTLSLDEDEAYKAWIKVMERLKEVEAEFLEAVNDDSTRTV